MEPISTSVNMRSAKMACTGEMMQHGADQSPLREMQNVPEAWSARHRRGPVTVSGPEVLLQLSVSEEVVSSWCCETDSWGEEEHVDHPYCVRRGADGEEEEEEPTPPESSAPRDACTSTDSLAWSVTPDQDLELLSRAALEQRLASALVMLGVLTQKLATPPRPDTHTPPAELREQAVQTQPSQPRAELYVAALEKIQGLELDQHILHDLFSHLQSVHDGMVRFSSEETLESIRRLSTTVHEDQETLSHQVRQMRGVCGRFQEALQRMKQKLSDATRRREEDLQEKEAVLRVTHLMRERHSAHLAELEHTVGSHQEVMSALALAHPSLVKLRAWSEESVCRCSEQLSRTQQDHDGLMSELRRSGGLLRQVKPVLLQLHHKSSAALQQREAAEQERQQAVDALESVRSQLHDCRQELLDLQAQQSIMSSEVCELRDQLQQADQERAELQHRSQELSATVTSSLASHAFLEQTLSEQSDRLQRSVCDTREAAERADCAEAELRACRGQLREYEGLLEERAALITQLSADSHALQKRIATLTQLQTDLLSAREMSEFLQAENELLREQIQESEKLHRCNLQCLRERNLQCEDLQLTVDMLRLEQESLQEELDSTRERARALLLDQGDQVSQACGVITLLTQNACSITDGLREALHPELRAFSPHPVQEPLVTQNPETVVSQNQTTASFLNSVIDAMMKPPETQLQEHPEEQQGEVSSECSAFTPVSSSARAADDGVGLERCGGMQELLAALGRSLSDLQLYMQRVRLQKEEEQQKMQQAICDLREESHTHALHLSQQEKTVDRLNTQLQQKVQEEKILRKLCGEMEEKIEAAQRYRAENSELRRDLADSRRMLHQTQAEVVALREELHCSTGQSEETKALSQRIKLLREVEKLKTDLTETEENRTKVLERAKRHQRVHTINQRKLERELHLLDEMVETVRQTLASVPDVVQNSAELQKLVEFLG